ncbi:hypothetical protein ACM614_29090 [Streptomyces sp. 12297]
MTVTQAAGSAAFTAAVEYASATSTAVVTARGGQDFARKSAYADITTIVPAAFPKEHSGLIGNPGTRTRTTLANTGDEVWSKTSTGPWLHSTWNVREKLGLGLVLGAHTSDDGGPFGRTAAVAVLRARPAGAPQPLPDGGRRYQATTRADEAVKALPEELTYSGTQKWGSTSVPVTVDLDAHGRLARAHVDYTALTKNHPALTGLTGLSATYSASGYGTTTVAKPPTTGVQEADRALLPLEEVKPGDCADTRSGVGQVSVVRAVDCGEPHDIRVFAQVTVSEPFTGDDFLALFALTEKAALRKCRDAAAHAPAADWLEGRTDYSAYGNPQSDGSTATGIYTCYVMP